MKIATTYVETLAAQIEKIDAPVSTIFIGGGTPTVLDNIPLEKLLKSLHKLIRTDIEFTVEANPESLTKNKLSILLNNGVNRLSVGVQSFNDNTLQKLGRVHSTKEAREAIYSAEKAGFTNIGLDLMFGIWGQTLSEWENDLRKAVQMPVKHISCYALTYEKDTPAESMLNKNSITALDDKTTSHMYKTAISDLSENDFKQYEISNFAKKDFECKHNINYWNNNEYIGLGASAVSYIAGSREKNVSYTSEYIKKASSGYALGTSREKLCAQKRAKETAAFKIRMTEGISFDWFKEKTGYDLLELEKESLPEIFSSGLLAHTTNPSGIRLTKKGLLLCDIVSSAFL